MRKVGLLVAAAIAASHVWAKPDENFRRMNPTVRVISYKKGYTGNVIPVATGSGTVISRDGLLLTNHHVIFDNIAQEPFDAFEIAITFDLKKEPVRKYTARLVAHDKALDVAILKLNPHDVFGEELPSLKYHDVDSKSTPREGDSVQVVGYPASGGVTLTITRGQISGFEKFNEYTCFKTDTDIDHGSSGGTVLNRKDHFIGIPVYLRTYAENVGYVLDLRDARPWIRAHIDGEPTVNQTAETRLVRDLARLSRANDQKTFTYAQYPAFTVELTDNWHFDDIRDDGMFLMQKDVRDPASIGIHMDRRPFPIDEEAKAELEKEANQTKQMFHDFEKSDVELGGAEGWKITYSRPEQRVCVYHLFVGNTIASIYYNLSMDAEKRQREAIDSIIETMQFDADPDNPPEPRRELVFQDPGFSLVLPKGWGSRSNPGSQAIAMLAEIWQKGNNEGQMFLSYDRVPRNQRDVPAKKRFEDALKEAFYGERIIRKQDDLMIDGLEGWLLVVQHEGESVKDVRKAMLVTLVHGDFELSIEYEDKSAAFDRNVDDMRTILTSLKQLDESAEGKGSYNVGLLSHQFSDINHHRFAEEIASLASKDLIIGFPDNTFRPEMPTTRARALKLIVDSKNDLEEDKKRGETIDLEPYREKPSERFTDVPGDSDAAVYVAYAAEHGLLDFIEGNRFNPDDTITTAQALRLLIGVYEIPVWKGETTTWYKRYMDKAIELGLLPRGLESPDRALTNAELAAIVLATYDSFSY